MAGNLHEVTDATFEQEVLKSTEPVLVDFWATWCGPCRALAPTIEAIANERVGRLKVCKVDVDHNPNIAAKLGIRSIPTIYLFHAGKKVDQMIGNVPKGAIEEMLKKVSNNV